MSITYEEPASDRLFDHPRPSGSDAGSGRLREIGVIKHLVAPYRRLAFTTWGLASLGQLLLVSIPLVTEYAIDTGVDGQDTRALVISGVLVALIVLGRIVSMTFQTKLGRKLAIEVARSMQTQTFCHLQKLSRHQIARVGFGTVLSRVTNDAPMISNLLQTGIVSAVEAATAIVGATVVMLILDWQLTLVLYAALPVVIIIGVVYQRALRPLCLTTRSTIANLTSVVHASFSNATEIQNYSQQQAQLGAFETASAANHKANQAVIRLDSYFNGARDFLASTMFGLLVIFGGLQAINGDIKVGTVVAFCALSLVFFNHAVRLTGSIESYEADMAAVDMVYQVLSLEPEIDQPAHPKDVPVGVQDLRFDGVCYAYDDQLESSLIGVDLVLPARKRVAIYGDLGAGTSTLAALAARLADPTRGVVTYGGVDCRQIDLQSLRSRIQTVSRDQFVFEGTIRDNLLVANPDVPDAVLLDLADELTAGQFLSHFPAGLEAEVKLYGWNLSSGQLVMLSVMRAIINRPDVVLIDRALDRLTPDAARLVMTALVSNLVDSTFVLITEREIAAGLADLVVVLDGGRVVEQGTYAELKGSGGQFDRLMAEQDLSLPTE